MPDDPDILHEFTQSLTSQDPKTVKAYQSAMRGFIRWLREQPGGDPFSPDQITETAIRGYMDYLVVKGRAPRTRSQRLTALSRFCRWAISAGYLQRNPASQIQRPTIVNTAPRELTLAQQYSLKKRVEREQSPRLSAIFALGYWAGLRVSEVAQLRLEHCHVNKRAGHITIADSKGGKTRTITLELSILNKLFGHPPLAYQISKASSIPVYVHRIAHYYIKCFDFVPYFRSDRDGIKKSEDYKTYYFKSSPKVIVPIINSSLFYFYWQALFDGFKAGKEAVEKFPCSEITDQNIRARLEKLCGLLMDDMHANSTRLKARYSRTGNVEYDQFFPRRSKHIMDEIDRTLAEHYRFTGEELDFIINYDIKYRMGDDLFEEEGKA